MKTLRYISLVLAASLLFAACSDVTDNTGADAGNDDNNNNGGSVDVPDTVLTAAPAELSNQSPAVFEFESDVAGASFECSHNGAPPAPCTSPHEIPVTDGEHDFEVAAIGLSGTRDPSPETHAWQVDLTPPDTTITSAPAALDNSVTVTFEFESDEASSFECVLNGGAATLCSSPYQISGLTDGAQQLSVTAIDLAGNADPTPAVHDWTIDTSAPDTQIDSGPSGETSSTDAVFEFSSADAGAGATFECAVDDEPFAACTSPYQASGLADGVHDFEVRVIDATGNTDPTPASRTWTVDTIAPAVTITSGPTGVTGLSQPQFQFAAAGSPVSVECRFDTGTFAACTSPVSPTSALADGDHVFEVRATDAAGNTGSASRAFTVDTMGPTVSITAGPSGPTNDNTPSFTFTTGGSPTEVECRIDTGAYSGCTSVHTTATLADGNHTFYVRATDAAGNSNTASRRFTVDTVAPTVSINSGPSGPTNDTTPSFGFTTGGGPTSTQCRVDSGNYASCSSPYTSAALSNGSHTVYVRVTDAAGNRATATRAFTVDTVAPTVSINSGPNGPTNDTTPSFGFTTGGGATSTQCRVDSGAYANCSSPYTSAALADGGHTVYVRATDAAGNQATTSRAFTVDTDGPTVSIIRGPSGVTNDNTPTHYFTTTGSPSSVQCRIDSGTYSNCTSPHTASTLSDGAHTLYVRVRDAAGNQDVDSVSFTVDTVAPSVTITGGPTGPTNDRTPTFTFTTSGSPTRVECAISGGSYAACSSPYTSAALAAGRYVFYVRVYDAAGNSSIATRAFSTDYTAPSLTITDGPPSVVYNAQSATFTFTASGHTGTRCRLYVQGGRAPLYTSCTSPWTYSNLGYNNYVFQVQAYDAAGNVVTRTWYFENQYFG